jgi:hypothetical protein
MKKGIVMEINDTFLTLLTPDGQFLQARKQDHSNAIGEEILFKPISKRKSAFVNRFIGVKQLSIAAAALFLFFGSLFPIYQNNKAYAYMSIDVNPSLELGINKQMQVIKLTAFNTDGEKIISHIGDWKKKYVTEIAQMVLKEMKKEGYLNKKHLMVISTVRTEAPEEKTEEQLTKDMGEIKKMANEDHLQVTVINGTEKEMEQAHQLGITTGKYKENKNQSVKKENDQQLPAQSQETENSGVLSNSPTESVNQGGIEAVHPNAPSVNNSKSDTGQSPTIENHTPPGQLKKLEEVPKEQQSPIISEQKNANKQEKKSLPINKNQEKNQGHSDEQNHNQEKHK